MRYSVARIAASTLIFSVLACVSQAASAQFTQQGPKLVGLGGVGVTDQGFSVALSVDGSTAIVGAPGDNSNVGAAWVFVRNGSTWTQQTKLVGTGGIGTSRQGTSVALSADGNTAIVGGVNDNAGAGAAWVFTRSGGTWSQQGPNLVGTGAIGAANQGQSVGLSADGNTAIVGGPNDNGGAGAAWLFTRSGGTWAQYGLKLVGSGAVGIAGQGASVALSGDGMTAILGGLNDNGNIGAAWIFDQSGGLWTQQGPKLVGTGAIGTAQQGQAVAISDDGNTAMLGGTFDNSGAGAVWIFVRAISGWTQQAKLVGSGAIGAGVQQGFSVGISGNGDTAIEGGPSDNAGAGAVWVFTRSGTTWSQLGAKLVGSGASGTSAEGFSVALSSIGTTILAGGVDDHANTGAAWVFVAPNFNPAATHDFNGDGISDILWLDTTHDVGMWLMNGATLLKGVVFNSVPAQWSVVGQRDFNGDGFADVLWRDNVGDVGMWLMNGTTIMQGGSFSSIPIQWSVAGTGDFNGDGKADILWVDTSNNLGIWFMNGTTILQTAVVGQLPTNWIVVGSDMKGGVFLRNTSTGEVGIWVINGTQIVQSVDLGPVPLIWTVAGIGDFDGNGSTDLLWRDTAGDVAIWLMNGTKLMSATTIGTVPNTWTIAETGDFNGDGKSDLLWIDSTGDVGIWFMNGRNISSTASYGNIGANWTVQALGAD
jgi:hypothetical protein